MSETTTESTETATTTSETDTVETDWKSEAEKWKANSRKHEERAKANSIAATELERLKAEALPEQERAVAEAKAAGRAEALKESGAALVRAEFKAAAADRMSPGLIQALDTSPYINDDGTVDVEAIAKFVADNAPPQAETEKKPDLPDFGQGKRGAAAASDDPLLAEIGQKLGGMNQ